MKKYLVIALLFVFAIGLSLFMIPGAREIATMQFRDKEFDKARETYEKSLAEGVLTIEVASALTNLHLQSGDVDKAIDVMQRFVEENPDNLAARAELGKLYQFAQRPDDYLANLAEINRIQESGDSLLTMNEMYAASQQYDKQEPALKALVGADGQRLPSHFRNLARIQANDKKIDEAVITYQELWTVHPTQFVFDDVEVLMSLQLEQDNLEGANETAVKYAASMQTPNTKQLARLVNILHYRGNPETAMAFLDRYEELIPSNSDLALEKVNILLAQQKTPEAYEMIAELDKQITLPISLQREYIYLLAINNEYDAAQERLESLDFTILQENEAISLLELSLARPDSGLMPILARKIDENTASQNSNLQAALAVATSKSDWKQRVDAVEKSALNNAQRIQMANICLLSKNMSCIPSFLDGLDETTLTQDETLRLAELNLEVGNIAKATSFIDPLYAQMPDNVAVSTLYVRIVAAQGNSDAVKSWLANNPTASEEALRNLYFTAQNYRQADISLDAVDVLAKNYESEENLGFLINAYVTNKRYEAVLPYFRDKSTLSKSDREDYLYVLTKLAKKNNQYSNELIAFASKEMQRSDVTQKQKEALVYALLDAGRPDVVLPFIEEFARNNGGQWIDVYASNLDKMGRHAQARDFRMNIATNPKTSGAMRRAIAFQLLETGYKTEAESLFAMMADNAQPDSADVQQLLYLWGPRPSADKLDWLGGRYEAASSDEEKAKWATMISNYAASDDLLALVNQHPSLVNNQNIQDRYFNVLNSTEQLQAYGDELLGRSDVTTESLRIFARAARAYNMPNYAQRAYAKILQTSPNDPEAMRVGGLLAFAQADYSETRANLLPYIEYRSKNPGYHVEDYEVYYYLAETFKRDGDSESANMFYAKSLEAVNVLTQADIDSISKTAQSLIGYGKVQEGRESFEAGRQQFPENRLLIADYISSMIEIKDYDKARDLIKQVPAAQSAANYSGTNLTLPLANVAKYTVDVKGNEAVLTFDKEVPKNFPLINATKAQYPWLSYVGQGYNEILIVAENDIQLELQPLSGGYQISARKSSNAAEAEFANDLDVRYQMLDARIGLETGDHYDVANQLVELSEKNPQNATLLGYTANALNFTGRWKYAKKLLDRANQIMPMNEDIIALQRDINIRQDAQDYVKVDYDWIAIGDSDINIWTLSGLVLIDEELEVGVVAQTAAVDAENVRRIDGRIGNFDENVQRGEIFVAHENLDGQRIQGSLYGNNDNMGAGAYYQWLNPLGVTRVYAEYQKPNWDFVEGILDDATRDRIGVNHAYVYNSLWSFNGGLAYNRYNLKDDDDIAQSVSGQFSATRVLLQNSPYLAANYSLDAEYRTKDVTRIDNNANAYNPLLESREVHTLSLIAAEQFTPQTDGLIQAGYSVDRMSSGGPLIAGQLTHQMFEDQLEAQLRGSYGARTSDSEGDTARLGGHLKWRF